MVKHLFLAFVLIMPVNLYGQETDADSSFVRKEVTENYSFKWRQTILPASLIGAASVALAPTFIRNGSRSFTNSIIDLRGGNQRLEFDDYLQYLPVVSSLMLGCAGIKSRHSFRDRFLVIATSYAALGVLTNIPKLCVNERRPEFSARNSFPSGHTATAFMGAELVRIEYGTLCGVCAYTIATGIGFMRMYNGRHWFHDVIAGAGVGILSARMGEWSCQLWQNFFQKKGKKKKEFVFAPIFSPFDGGHYGLSLGYIL